MGRYAGERVRSQEGFGGAEVAGLRGVGLSCGGEVCSGELVEESVDVALSNAGEMSRLFFIVFFGCTGLHR